MSYRSDFRELEQETRWTAKRLFTWGLILFCLFIAFRFIAMPLWFAGRAITVAQQQLDPAELLRKYEWFKDASAQLDAKAANIRIEQQLIDDAKSEKDKDRTDKEQLNLWRQELGGMKYSFNSLAADYNAQMAKINYRFCNVGDLPQGASNPLPREYKPYQEN